MTGSRGSPGQLSVSENKSRQREENRRIPGETPEGPPWPSQAFLGLYINASPGAQRKRNQSTIPAVDPSTLTDVKILSAHAPEEREDDVGASLLSAWTSPKYSRPLPSPSPFKGPGALDSPAHHSNTSPPPGPEGKGNIPPLPWSLTASEANFLLTRGPLATQAGPRKET